MFTSRRKLTFWIITLTVPCVLLVLLELGLRFWDDGDDLALVSERSIAGKDYFVVNPGVSRRYFLGTGMPPPRVYDDVFLKKKSPSTFRIFCLGESTMQGFPYEYNGALPRLLYDRLHLSFPARDLEVINLGITAVSSTAVVDILQDVMEYEPDLVVVYAGHNEFYGALGTASIQRIASPEWINDLYLKLVHFRTFRLMSRSIAWMSRMLSGDQTAAPAESMMEFMAEEKSVPFSSDLYSQTRERFIRHLNRIADITKERQIPLVLSTLVSNTGDMPPFVSLHDTTLRPDLRDAWSAAVQSATLLRRGGQVREALRQFELARNIDSSSADLTFAMAGCRRELGDSSGAARLYLRARDLDALRFRASSEFNDSIRALCARRRILLADIEQAFADVSDQRIVGSSLLLEHVHPNLDGYFLMAATYADLIERTGLIARGNQTIPRLPDEVYKSLAMMTVFDFEVSFFRLDYLLHRWPFSEPDSTRHVASTEEGRLAREYIAGKISWEQAHYTLGAQYASRKEFPQALREYLALGKVFWNDYQPLMLAGDQYFAMGDIPKAQSMYERARAREENPFTLVRMGAVLGAQSLRDEAAGCYQHALRLDRESTSKLSDQQRIEVRLHLAELLAESGKLKDAGRELGMVLAERPDDRRAILLRERIAKESAPR